MGFRGKSGKLLISVMDTRPHSHTCSSHPSHALSFFAFEMHGWIFQKCLQHVCTLISLHKLSKQWVGEFDRLLMRKAHVFVVLCSFSDENSCWCLIPFYLFLGWFSLKSRITLLSLCFSLVSVEPGVWLSLEGTHCQVLFAGGLHIWLPSDGCHGWLVSCLMVFMSVLCHFTASVS